MVASERNRLLRAALMGGICFPCGLMVGLHLRLTAIGDYSVFPYYSSCAAFLAPAVAWWVLVESRQTRTRARGIAAGAAGVILAHHLTWYLLLLVSNVQYWLRVGRFGEAPLDPLLGFFAVALYTVISLVFYGWLTLPYGMIAGYLLMRKTASTEAPASRESDRRRPEGEAT